MKNQNNPGTSEYQHAIARADPTAAAAAATAVGSAPNKNTQNLLIPQHAPHPPVHNKNNIISYT